STDNSPTARTLFSLAALVEIFRWNATTKPRVKILNTIMKPEEHVAKRVAIVAAGIVSPLGFGLAETLQSLRQARDCVTPVTAFPVDKTRCKTAAQIDDERLLSKAQRRRDRRLHRASHMVIAALAELLEAAPEFPPEIAIVGTTSGGMSFG